MEYSGESLFEYAQQLLAGLRKELPQYGLEISSELELRRGSSVLVYYDTSDGHIYLSLPDPEDPVGRFQSALFRPMLACENQDELNELIGLLMPRLIAHEVGHHLRHRHGKFSDDLWYEEQVANMFASAATRLMYSQNERSRLVFMLVRALAALKANIDFPSIAVDTYHTPLRALVAGGELSRNTVQTLELMASLFAIPPEQILVRATGTPTDLVDRIGHRATTIHQFNDNYTSELLRYTYLQLGWSLIDLNCGRHHYFDEIARDQIGLPRPAMPELDVEPGPTPSHIVRCYQAYQALKGLSPVASRYFFKRYRSSLLKYAAEKESDFHSDDLLFSDQALRLFESHDEENDCNLRYAALLAPAAIRWLFPPIIQIEAPAISADFLYPIDIRVWRQASGSAVDDGASALLERIAWLEMSHLFRPLPADLLVELAHHVCHVKVAEGALVIQQGAKNDDVFLLISGRLGLSLEYHSDTNFITEFEPGDIIGDMAYLSGEPRTADIFAIEPSDCLLIRSTLLHRLAFTHPIILMQLGRILVRKLSALSKTKG